MKSEWISVESQLPEIGETVKVKCLLSVDTDGERFYSEYIASYTKIGWSYMAYGLEPVMFWTAID